LNRRTSLKGILTLGILGVSSFSVYNWINLHRKISLTELLSFKQLLAELAETIIPETDTPGAKRAGVENYILNVISNCTSKVDQNRFLIGLHDVENHSLVEYNKSFILCKDKERVEILNFFQAKDVYKYQIIKRFHNKILGQTFFSKLKQLTVEGYCCSEIGATKGLAYDYIPGKYHACIALNPNQKSWATK